MSTEQVDRVTVVKKTDQLNFEDFLHGVTLLVTITGVTKGDEQQQYNIAIEGDRRAWRPPATVLKLLVEAWGDDAKEWVGRRAMLYGDPTIKFGPKTLGGIRVSHVSHIDKPVSANLSVTRGQRQTHTVQPLTDALIKAAKQDEWRRTDDPERRKQIEAEVKALGGGSE